jgi:hypothetical protein
VSLTSNEDLGSPLLDNVSGWVGWKQYLKGAQLGVSYMLADFFDDEDRSGNRYRQAVAVDVLYDLWVDSCNRLELGVEYRHDFPTNVGSGFVFLSWHFSNGRGYLDFWPGDVDFLPLRTSRVPDGHGNSLGGQDRG